MEINELVKYVNEELSKGLKISEIESTLNLGKDTLRKKLNKNKYKYNKGLRQYLYTETKQLIDKEISKNITHDNTKVIQKNNTKVTQEYITQNIAFSLEDIEILKKLILNYKSSNSAIEYNLNGNLITRSIRTYEKVLDEFSLYCKENHLKQKDSIAIALINYMNRNK